MLHSLWLSLNVVTAVMGIMGSLIFIIKKRERERGRKGSWSPEPGAVGTARDAQRAASLREGEIPLLEIH